MIRPISQEIADYLKTHDRFLIMAHQKPDGDAIGSAIALGLGLKKCRKKVDYYVQTPVEQKLAGLPEINCFNRNMADHYDALVFVDCSTLSFAFKPKELPPHDCSIVIDHHQSNEGYGVLNHVEVTSATAELVFRLLMQMNIELDAEIADAVFAGISTDTGSFQFSNVTAETHEIVAQLYAYRNDFAVLSKQLHCEKSYDQMKMYGAAASVLKVLDDGRIGWVLLDHATIQKYGGDINITDDIANIGMNTLGIMVAATIKEITPGQYRISLRSRSPFDIDVSVIAKRYGGGGHKRAAGLTFAGDLMEIQNALIDLVAGSIDR